MTTIVYRDGVMCGDGQVTRYDCLIEASEFVKVKNIGNCLVGGAGNGMSIVKFFDWFEDNVKAEWAQAQYEHLTILPPEDLVEQDFQALVVDPEGKIFEYVGTKNVFPVSEPYASIGSGCVFAYPLLDAGFTAREAVEGAIKRCPYSGGVVTEITFDKEPELLTPEEFDSLDKESLRKRIFGEDVKTEEEIIQETLEQIGAEPVPDKEELKTWSNDQLIDYILGEDIPEDEDLVMEDPKFEPICNIVEDISIEGEICKEIWYTVDGKEKALTLYANGAYYDEDGETNIEAFEVDMDYERNTAKAIAKSLEIPYPKNITTVNLQKLIVGKFKEIIDDMNK